MEAPFPQTEQAPGLFVVAIHPEKLIVTLAEIGRALGYGDKTMPEHFSDMIGDIFARLQSVCGIQCGYRLLDIRIAAGPGGGIYAGETLFGTSSIVTSQLKDADTAAVFACTIGPAMEQWRRTLELDSDEVRALLVDAVASAAVEAATGLLHDHIQAKMRERGLNVTNRFSPGYCGWPVTDQQALFSRFPKRFCDITLTESSLMIPMKSVSGIIGIGARAARKDYPCSRCEREFCMYRSYPQSG
jgi:hypothetical protein